MRAWLAPLIFLLFPSIACASWLSDVTGINIDLQRAIGDVARINASERPADVVQSTAPPPPVVTLVKTAQKAKLEAQFERAAEGFKKEADKYESYSVALAISSIVMAFAAALSGFLRQAILAGTLSLAVTAATGVPRVLPLGERATYYRSLYGEAVSIATEMALHEELSLAEYNQRVDQLKTILLYASKLPGVGDVRVATDELIKQVRSTPPVS